MLLDEQKHSKQLKDIIYSIYGEIQTLENTETAEDAQAADAAGMLEETMILQKIQSFIFLVLSFVRHKIHFRRVYHKPRRIPIASGKIFRVKEAQPVAVVLFVRHHFIKQAILDRFPANEGHVLILPKNHTPNIFEIDPEQAGRLFTLAAKIARGIYNIQKNPS